MTRLTDLVRQSAAGLRLLLALTVLLGVAYPAVVLGASTVLAVPRPELGQSFEGGGWFQPRPSAAGDGYDPQASGASNLGPSNPDLVAMIEERRAAVAAREGVDPARVPADAVTASGSGLDPDVSPAYAQLQVARVARERGLPETAVEQLVAESTRGRDLGFIGEPHVDVVALNRAVAAASGTPSAS